MKQLSQFFSSTSHTLFLLSLGIFTLLRFPSLFEPHWYGDEGIYQTIGVALTQGIPLYEGVWDNKPPLLYLIYGLGHGDQFILRLSSLIIGLITVALFYKLAGILIKKQGAVSILTILFAILFGSPYLEGNIANAENFMLLPILLGIFLILQYKFKKDDHRLSYWIKNSTTSLLVGGFFLGISFMTKIVGIFDLFAILFFIGITTKSFYESIKRGSVIIGGFLFPFIVVSIYFLATGLFDSYIRATFFSNVSYVGYENFFLIPQGLLVIKLLILGGFLFYLFLRRHILDTKTLFILVWFGFSLFNSFFSQRSYTHYLLLSLPSILLVGFLAYENVRKRLFIVIAFIFLIIFLINHFKPFPLTKSVLYYENFISYAAGQKSQYKYQLFFDKDVPRDYEIAEYLDMKLAQNERVFIYGNSAQIYTLSHTLPVSRYTVAYHINSQEAIDEVQNAINMHRPRFVVILPDQRLSGIILPNYVYRLHLGNTAIYEFIN